jgi:serine/threonine-protein kinase HipA
MTQKLIAYKDTSVVGTLIKTDEENYVFCYAVSWLESRAQQPLSLTLPLRAEPFSSEATKAFFANLLPEGQIRDHYASKFRVSPDDDFALLAQLAGDCAGAIVLYPEGEAPLTANKQQRYRTLSDKDFGLLFNEAYIMDPTFLGAEEKTRLSLAGVQDKLPLTIQNQEYKLPLDGAPSTHILKPQNHRYDSLVENELFCMTLAKAMNLDVPETFMLIHADENSYVIERYDRSIGKNNTIIRIHQEDFCQATGTSYRKKYEEKGGPGYKACFDVIKECKKPLADRIKLVNLVVFNYLICNADCHAKNTSLLYNDSTHPDLAPFYDLVCTAVYPGLSQKLAMSIGGEFDPRNIIRQSWEKFSQEIGDSSVRPTLKTLERMAKEVLVIVEGVAEELIERYGENPIYLEIVRAVTGRANTALRQIQN